MAQPAMQLAAASQAQAVAATASQPVTAPAEAPATCSCNQWGFPNPGGAGVSESNRVSESMGVSKSREFPNPQKFPNPLPENCRGLCPCTGLTKNTARKLQGGASLSQDYQNHYTKIARSCVLALGLQKPLPENCRELRPCTGLAKTSARKLPRVASLHWA